MEVRHTQLQSYFSRSLHLFKAARLALKPRPTSGKLFLISLIFRDTSYAGELVDVWALGVLLFFMLIGVTPFKAETVPDMKVLITAGKYQIPDYVSLLATELIKSMLKTDTGQRADIDSVKKHFWMRDCRFTKSYLSIKATAKIDNEEEKKAIDDKVIFV